jgi:hypothetical protein
MAATRGPASTPRCEGAGPRIAAIISVIETCWRLRIRPRDYFDAILPGLAGFPVNRVAEFVLTVWAQTRLLPSWIARVVGWIPLDAGHAR